MCGYECGEATKSTRKKKPASRKNKEEWTDVERMCVTLYERHHRGHIGRHRQVDERGSILKIEKKNRKKISE